MRYHSINEAVSRMRREQAPVRVQQREREGRRSGVLPILRSRAIARRVLQAKGSQAGGLSTSVQSRVCRVWRDKGWRSVLSTRSVTNRRLALLQAVSSDSRGGGEIRNHPGRGSDLACHGRDLPDLRRHAWARHRPLPRDNAGPRRALPYLQHRHWTPTPQPRTTSSGVDLFGPLKEKDGFSADFTGSTSFTLSPIITVTASNT